LAIEFSNPFRVRIDTRKDDQPDFDVDDSRDMTTLTRHGGDVDSVFDLLGRNENDLTAALGFALSHCPPLASALIERVWPGHASQLAEAHFALEVRGEVGRTDLEVRLPTGVLILEAKRGWLLPTKSQLTQYVDRIIQHGDGALVTLSQASAPLAATQLPSAINGVPVVHLSWRDVLADISSAQPDCRGRQRFWLDELRTYLKGVIRMRSIADSWTYCVVLNDDRPGGKGAPSFKEYVTEGMCYFHPYGEGGWPTEPPNFMAFRWDGKVQRIHRVLQSEVIPSIRDRFPKHQPGKESDRAHAVYQLGPRLPPLEPIPSGTTYRAARLWVLLDQLQTAPTLKDAIERSRALNDLGG
jgi:hypothetical protein